MLSDIYWRLILHAFGIFLSNPALYIYINATDSSKRIVDEILFILVTYHDSIIQVALFQKMLWCSTDPQPLVQLVLFTKLYFHRTF